MTKTGKKRKRPPKNGRWEEEMTLLFIHEDLERNIDTRKEIGKEIDAKLLEMNLTREIFKDEFLSDAYTRMVKEGKIIPQSPPPPRETEWLNEKFYHIARQEDMQRIHPRADRKIDQLLEKISAKGRTELPYWGQPETKKGYRSRR